MDNYEKINYDFICDRCTHARHYTMAEKYDELIQGIIKIFCELKQVEMDYLSTCEKFYSLDMEEL